MNVEFLVVLGLLAFCSIVLIWLGSWRIITPPGVVGYYILVLYWMKMVWNYSFGVGNLFEVKWSEFVLPFSLLIFSLFLVVVVSFRNAQAMRNYYSAPHNICKNPRPLKLRPIFWVFAIIMPWLVLCYARYTMNFWAWESPMLFRSYIQSSGRMYVYLFVMFLSQLTVIYCARCFFIDKKIPHMWAFLALGGAVVYNLGTGFTSSVISLWFPAIFCLCLRRGFRFEFLLPFAFPLVAYYAMVHLVYKEQSMNDSAYSLVEAYERVRENPDFDYGFMNRIDYPEQLVLSVTDTLEGSGPDWGANMVGVAVQFVPRSVWPDKPYTFSVAMTKKLHPGHYDLGIVANYGGFSEFINAFGLMGILGFVLTVTGLLFLGASIYRKACFCDKWMVAYIMGFHAFLAGGFTVAFVNDLWLFNAIIVILLITLFTKNSWRLTNLSPMTSRRSGEGGALLK